MLTLKKCKTEFSEENQHLSIQLPEIFPSPSKRKDTISPIIDDNSALQTNFGIAINNPYAFILLHLRNKGVKNPMHLNIPEVAVFYDRSPYDIIYSHKGYIRGLKSNEQQKMRLKDINRNFKDNWSTKNLPKQQHTVAVFAQKQVLMLSDNDLFLACCKTKADPFFKKLRYFQNKIPPSEATPIKVTFPSKQNTTLIKMATESLLGFQDDSQTRQSLSQEQYLSFLNQKIALYLNYQHNIRLHSAIFTFSKTDAGEYFFVNIQKIDFSNLTEALLNRQKKLKEFQEERNKILIMSTEKQRKYKSYENKTQVKTFQHAMNNQFNSIVRRLDFHTISDNKREQIKNEIAFKKLHPKSKFTYTQVVTGPQFMKTKAKVFNTPSRKPLTSPTRHMMKFYNKVRNPRIQTQTINVFKD